MQAFLPTISQICGDSLLPIFQQLSVAKRKVGEILEVNHYLQSELLLKVKLSHLCVERVL